MAEKDKDPITGKQLNNPGLDEHEAGQAKAGRKKGKSAANVKRDRQKTKVKEFEGEQEDEMEVYSVDDTVTFKWGENEDKNGKQYMKPGTEQKLHQVHAESLQEKGFGKIISKISPKPKLPPESSKK